MKVNITAALISKLNVLSSEYNIEVGGYLTGKIKEGQLWLDDLLIPDQRITSTSVEIDTKDQVSLFRKYGARCKDIVGHWHSHHSMGCFWSGTDLTNMNNIMGYKDLYVFIVSSQGNHKVKVCMKNPLTLEFDDCELYIKTVMIDQLRMRMKQLMSNDTTPNYLKGGNNMKHTKTINEKMNEISEETKNENTDEEIIEEGNEEITDYKGDSNYESENNAGTYYG